MLDLREAFFLPEPEKAVELRAFTHGLMPKTVPAMMDHFLEDWRTRGVDAWNEVPNHWQPDDNDASVGWWALPEYLGDAFIAPLLNAPEGTCIMLPNVHHAAQALFSAPEIPDRGGTLVITEAAFPSLGQSARRWADLLDMDVRVVPPRKDGFVDQEALLETIGTGTALIGVSHVGFTTGEKLTDSFLHRLAGRAHDADALLVVDGYHAACSVPLDVEALGVDVYLGGLLKEGSGSSGNAFAYVRDGLALSPRLTGWLGHATPFAFAPHPAPHPDVRRRFVGGTTPVAPLYHAVEGVRVLLNAGLEAVRADSLAKTAYAIERADKAGLTLRSPSGTAQRGAMVILEAPAADRLCTHLKHYHIYTDSRRKRYLRMAPFVWNTQRELERAFDSIERAVRDGKYRDVDVHQSGPVT